MVLLVIVGILVAVMAFALGFFTAIFWPHHVQVGEFIYRYLTRFVFVSVNYSKGFGLSVSARRGSQRAIPYRLAAWC